MEKFDAIIVGSGPIGIGVARRLAERGRRVLVLEAGRSKLTADTNNLS